jgi:hypothetical protein
MQSAWGMFQPTHTHEARQDDRHIRRWMQAGMHGACFSPHTQKARQDGRHMRRCKQEAVHGACCSPHTCDAGQDGEALGANAGMPLDIRHAAACTRATQGKTEGIGADASMLLCTGHVAALTHGTHGKPGERGRPHMQGTHTAKAGLLRQQAIESEATVLHRGVRKTPGAGRQAGMLSIPGGRRKQARAQVT